MTTTKQAPIHSGYGPQTIARDVIANRDLTGATSPQLDGMGGVYCEDADVAQAVPGDFPEQRGVRPWAMDPTLAERPWTKTEEWTGVRFPS